MRDTSARIVLAACVVVLIILMTLLISVVYPFWNKKAPLKDDFNLGEVEGMEFDNPIERGAVLGAHWFGRVQRTDGSYVYIFDPDNNTEITRYGYSLARHSASIYPLVWAYEHTGDERYLECAEDAAAHVEGLIRRNGDVQYILNGERSSLFDNALTLIGYCYLYDSTGDEDHLYRVRGLANLCLDSMDSEGRFDYTYEYVIGDSFDENMMASGEALLGLALACKVTGDEEYLEGYVKSAAYHMNFLTYGNCMNMSTAYYSWMSSAFSEGYHLTGEQKYADAAFDITEWMLKYHYGSYFGNPAYPDQEKLSEYPELWGSFRTFPSMNTCTYCEGMTDVLGVAMKLDDTDRIERYTDVLLNASGFICNLMYDTEEAYQFESPHLVLGGFRHDLFDRINDDMGWQSRWIRIDYTQHAIGALFRMLKIIPAEELNTHEWRNAV
ncbi:MAG: hypothetical protein ACMUIE_00815 [Thermoplasmatota archaeon]